MAAHDGTLHIRKRDTDELADSGAGSQRLASVSALVALALVATVALGATLRAFFAGSGWLPGGFAELRHAHTHLGWYGVILPATVAVWRRLPGGGVLADGSAARAGYAAAVGAAGIGFAAWGYGVVAIAASTMILAFWLAWALRLWRAGLARGAFLSAPIGILAAAAAIPMVAFNVRRDPAFAQALVAAFLGALLFCVALPAALHRAGLRTSAAVPYLVVALGSALYLGPLHGVAALTMFPLGLGALLLRAAWGPGRRDIRALVAVVAAALALHALGQLPWTRQVAIAAVHFGLLGPVMHGLLLDASTSRGGGALRWCHHALLGAMCLAIARPDLHGGAMLAAACGGLLALGWATWAVVALQIRARAFLHRELLA